MRLAPPLFAALLLPALAAAQSSNSAPPTIQVTSRIVNVDVVVRDSNGRMVHGLKKDDFRVLEDGKPQTISYFDEHTYDIAAAERMSKPNPGTVQTEFSNVPAKGAIAGSINIILFDLFDTPSTDQLYARQQLLKFIETMPLGQQVALFVLGDRLQMVQDFTGSSDRLIEAARQIRPADFGLVESETNAMQENDFAADLANAAGHNITGHPLGASGGSSGCSGNSNIRATVAFATLNVLARATNGYPQRKNLFWLSDCFPIALGSQVDATKFINIATIPGARDTANLVADSQIAVFPICLLGLETGGVPASVDGVGEVSMAGMGSTLHKQFVARASMRAWEEDLARETGGEAFFGTNDFAGAIRRGMDDESNYYAIAYRPQNSNWNKQFRKIRVEMLKSGYSLSYQRGYFAFPDEPSLQGSVVQQLDAALQPESPESTLLLLHAKLDLSDIRQNSIIVHSVLDAGNLGLVTGSDGHRRGQLAVRLIAFNDTPNSNSQPDAPPQSSGILNLDFGPAQYQAILADGIAFSQQLNLSPGRYRLRLGVTDVVSHRIGTLDMPVTIPAQAAKN
jgi:VWFA-related protein